MATKYQRALSSFNRSAGQLKRYYDIEPEKYLEGVHTVKGVERALKQMQFEAEQIQIERAVEKYEKKTRVLRAFKREQRKIERAQTPKFYFDEAKQAAYEKEVEAYEQAAQTFMQNWGGFSRSQYDQFVSFIGALPEEYKSNEAFGSKSIVEAWRQGKSYNLSDEQIIKTMGKVLDESAGGNQEDVINNLYDALEAARRD